MSTAPGAPAPVPAPRRTSVTGPVLLTAGGALLLVVALVVGVLTAVGLVRTVDTGVVRADGGPGPAVLAWADAPGATTVDLDAGERYVVHAVAPRSSVRGDDGPRLTEPVLLQAPSGQVVAADRSPSVTSRSGRGGVVATTVGAFTAPEAGTYRVAVPPASAPGTWVALTPDQEFGPFFGAIAGTVLGVFVVLGLAGVGFVMLVGGVVWWVLRVRARRGAAA